MVLRLLPGKTTALMAKIKWTLMSFGLVLGLINAQPKPTLGLELRTMAIATDNKAPFKDAFALGSAGAVSLRSPQWKGVSAQFKASAVIKHYTSDLATPDSLTNLPNRYEIRLFDVEHLQTNPMLRLEEANVQWQHRKTQVIAGMQRLQTPFLNAQDGFLRPNTFGGINLKTSVKKEITVESAWLSHVLVRSTDSWYSIQKSIGIYGVGVNVNGEKSNYAKQISSKGIGLFSLRWKAKPTWHIQFWNTFAENVSNTAFIQVDWKQKAVKRAPFIGIQTFWQRQVGNGGNENTALQYYPDTQVGGISTQVGTTFPMGECLIAYTYIGRSGRFLMPREWGREPFYTFIMRERNEGMGGVNAWKGHLLLKPKWGQIETSYGFYKATSELRLNKYQLPSYHHVRLDMRWQITPKGFISGRWTHKWHQTQPLNAKWVYNKVDLSIWEAVLELKL